MTHVFVVYQELDGQTLKAFPTQDLAMKYINSLGKDLREDLFIDKVIFAVSV